MKELETILKQEEKTVFALRRLYSRYGYAQYKMSKFEEYELYVRNKNFLVSDHIITFTDTNGKLMALKPDVTLSIVKNSKVPAGEVQKVYYDEKVYRVSKGGDSFREIPQVGLECLGEIDRYGILEVLTLAAKSLDCISDEYVLDVSHLGILSAMLEPLHLSSRVRQQLLQCVGEKNVHGIASLCKGEEIDADVSERLQTLVATYGQPKSTLPILKTLCRTKEEVAAFEELETVCKALDREFTGKIRLDFSVVSDLSYYNGIVFKGFVNGIPSAVLTGGQYDKLVQKLGKKANGIGFAVYLDLLGELFWTRAEYDADVLLLYEADTDLIRLQETVAGLIDEGKSVCVCRSKPQKKTFRTQMRMTQKGVEVIETDA